MRIEAVVVPATYEFSAEILTPATVNFSAANCKNFIFGGADRIGILLAGP
jgi:hypothetical protein